MQKEAFEPTGLIPRSIIRTFDRFVQQLLPETESIAIQEYRVSRYQILVSIKALFTLICVPLFINYVVKSFLLTPLTEFIWNSQQEEIFLNAYQERRAFEEMEDFSEKIFFESMIQESSTSANQSKDPSKSSQCSPVTWITSKIERLSEPEPDPSILDSKLINMPLPFLPCLTHHVNKVYLNPNLREQDLTGCSITRVLLGTDGAPNEFGPPPEMQGVFVSLNPVHHFQVRDQAEPLLPLPLKGLPPSGVSEGGSGSTGTCTKTATWNIFQCENVFPTENQSRFTAPTFNSSLSERKLKIAKTEGNSVWFTPQNIDTKVIKMSSLPEEMVLQKRFQEKSLEVANNYNKQSILAITNLVGDFITFFTVYLLFVIMKPQIIILKSFLTESVYSLSDTTKSFLLILVMDLLVGFHSPRGWEIALESLLRHLGLPESENFILLFVALFPVFLDTVFKYWIFRYLNKISPSTVVTYHSMLE